MSEDQINSSETFERALASAQPQPRDLPMVWDEGQHRYYRIEEAVEAYPSEGFSESRLSDRLRDLHARGVRVLDCKRVAYTRDDVLLCDWVVKTMIPRE